MLKLEKGHMGGEKKALMIVHLNLHLASLGLLCLHVAASRVLNVSQYQDKTWISINIWLQLGLEASNWSKRLKGAACAAAPTEPFPRWWVLQTAFSLTHTSAQISLLWTSTSCDHSLWTTILFRLISSTISLKCCHQKKMCVCRVNHPFCST